MEASPSIRTLAKIAGVSPATVSLALRDHPRIRPSERTRIQQIATDAGYKPNALMARLNSHLRMSKTVGYKATLGIVFTATRKGDAEEPSVLECVQAAQAHATEIGYGSDQFVLYRSALSPARLSAVLEARNIEGLVLFGPFSEGIIPPKFDLVWKKRAAVVIGEPPVQPPLSYVSNDQFCTCHNAVRELIKLGYRRPALCIHPDVDNVLEQRFQGGFLVGQRALPAADRLPIFAYTPDGAKPFKEWIESFRPDVILTLHCEIRDWLKRMGLRAPDEIGLAHLDWRADLKDWAGMRQNHDQIGVAAVDMVVGQLQRNAFGVPPFQKCMTIRGTWVAGPSVRLQA